MGVGAFAALPLVVGDRLIGVLAIGYRRPRHFSASERQLLTVYAAHAAALLEQVRLLEAARTQAQREALLVELSSVVNATLDVEALARLVVRRLPELVPADRCAFGLYDPASGRLTRRLRRLETGEIDLTPDLMRDVASTGYLAAVRELRSVVDNDLRTLPTEPERQYAAEGMRARIVTPVVVDGVCRAVFGVSSFRSNVYGPDHVRLVEAVAAQLAVALRNADLLAESQAAYRALQETQARLVESEKLRVAGQLASGVAHDQNNVLTVILGHAELALDVAQDPAVRFSLEQIIRAAEGGAETVRRLQEYARIRRDGGQPLEALDLNEVVREAIALASPRWERSNAPRDRRPITVLLDLAPDLPLVAGERYPLHEILINLLFNAVDALPQGGRITVRTSAAPDRRTVRCAVADTGVGMPPEVLARCFEPFFTTKAESGTGLGLALVQSLVHRLGGEVTAASEPGRGTTITFDLLAISGGTAGSTVPSPGARSRALRIALVDDEAPVRAVLRELLTTEGHQIHTFATGDAFLAWLAGMHEPLDLLLTDLGLPIRTGWEVAREARRLRPGLRIALLTGYGTEVDPAAASDQGIDLVLTKPVRLADLRRAFATLAPP